MKIIASLTVLLTILSSLAFGIACGHLAILAILRLLGHTPRTQQAPSTSVPASAVAVPTTSGH